MTGFETPFSAQVTNVLNGRTADGTAMHALWKLPDAGRFKVILDKVTAVSLWSLYRAPENLRRREDLRTFVIWSTAAHIQRLTRAGDMLDNAAREVTWLSLIMLDHTDFTATSAFARKMMPDLLPLMPRAARADIRSEALRILRTVRRRWKPRDLAPPILAHDTRYAVRGYRIPAHFLSNPAISSSWTDHLAAVASGAGGDHEYWTEVAQGQRTVYAFFIGEECKATFESRDGHLHKLVLHDPADDVVYDRLSYALAHLAHIAGNIFKMPNPRDVTPATLTLIATRKRQALHAEALIKQAKAHNARKGKASLPPGCRPPTTDRFIGYAALFLAMSYLLPLSVVTGPLILNSYVRVWRMALGIAPNCTTAGGSAFDCLAIETPTQEPDMRMPLPPHGERR